MRNKILLIGITNLLVLVAFPQEPLSQGMTHLWSQSFGDADYQFGYSVALDPSRNVVVTGVFAGTVDFGGGPLTSAGMYDIFLAKFDGNGTHLWSQRFGDASNQVGYCVAFDPSGNVVMTGYFWGTVDFGGGPLTSTGGYDIFLAKFDPNGTHLWSQRFGDANTQFGWSVAFDHSGNVAITGEFSGTVDFGGGPLTSAGVRDIFLAKFDGNGTHLWSQRFGDADWQLGSSVAFDPSGNVVMTGGFYGTVDFGGGPLTSAGAYDIFLAKFDGNGNHLWSQRFGDAADYQGGLSVASDPSGNVVMTGQFEGTVDFGGGPLPSAGSYDIFLAKFDGNGTHLWSQRFGDASNQVGLSVAFDPSGNVVMTGGFYGTVDFGGGPLTSAGAYDIFLAKFDGNGNHLWSQRFGDADLQWGSSVAFDPSGNVVMTGNFCGTVDFGGGPLTSAGSYDIFLAKFGFVSDPAVLLSDLIDFVTSLNLPHGIENSLLAKLNAALHALEDQNPNNDVAAINALQAFINEVNAQRGKKISNVDADALITTARQIINLIQTGGGGGQSGGGGGSIFEMSYSLSQNFPNPIRHSTTIRYQIPMRNEGFLMRSHVSLKVYDISGRVVRTLVNEDQKTGTHTITWDRKDDLGREISNGVYFYRLQISLPPLIKGEQKGDFPFSKGGKGDFVATRKMVLLK